MSKTESLALLKHYVALAEIRLQAGERPELLLPLLRLAAQFLEQDEEV
ncbi:hypothetical protein Dxin01_02138 [Deinococcus xinjiangensis]|uniref:Uncharacterized protein n=1 Tax=Deinococcus xinjiangensis TaxID=457454 RepID=A0ABP9VAV4_9DEIO